MYLRHTIRRKDAKTHRYWRLVRSERHGRRIVQRTVAHLGELDARGQVRTRALARSLIGAPEQADLFDDGKPDVTVPVRLKGVRVERSRQFGDVYLALALWRGTGLAELCDRLLASGKESVPWSTIASVLMAARLCEPSSELHIAEDWLQRTALTDLLRLSDDLVNKDRLYRALDHLLEHKSALEAHLALARGSRARPHPRLLPRLRPVEDPGDVAAARRSRQFAADHPRGTGTHPVPRCRSAYIHDGRHQIALHRAA
jgi:hypothetical protein